MYPIIVTRVGKLPAIVEDIICSLFSYVISSVIVAMNHNLSVSRQEVAYFAGYPYKRGRYIMSQHTLSQAFDLSDELVLISGGGTD